MAEIIAPVAGATSTTGVAYPLKNTQVFRPGQPSMDANGKKVTSTGQLYTALYNGTYAEALEIKNNMFKTVQDQNYIKTLMYQSGLYASKNEFQSTFWSTADTAAFSDLLKEANSAGGYSWEEMAQVYQKGGKAGGGPQVQKSINLSDPKTADSIINTAGQSLLGRDMSAGEKNLLRGALTQAEKASPSISTTTQNGNSYSTVTTGGLDRMGKEQVIKEGIMASDQLLPEAVNNQLNGYGDIIARLAAGQ
jgi:hypothetical protein